MRPPTLLGWRLLGALALASRACSLDNGVGLTPAMGYNTWDDFRCGGINSTNVMKVADAIVRYGLDKVGYEYLGLDDCWAASRDSTGVILPDPKAFPDGMKAVADYVHQKGLKFGIYTDRGTATCVGRPGSQGYESIDAKTYAEWGVDLVKEDSCSAPTDHNASFAQCSLYSTSLCTLPGVLHSLANGTFVAVQVRAHAGRIERDGAAHLLCALWVVQLVAIPLNKSAVRATHPKAI